MHQQREDPERFFRSGEDLEWDIDASTIPWAAGMHLPQPQEPKESRRPPAIFYPNSQLDSRPLPSLGAEDGYTGLPSSPDASCFVIIFGLGTEATEGIYTLRTLDNLSDADGAVLIDTVVAFENEIDAQRFVTLLEPSLTHKPSVFSISWCEVTEWCEENNTRCRLEPAGSLLIPPEANVGVTDWERALALQRGEYHVLDAEPAVGYAQGASALPADYLTPTGFFIDGPEWVYEDEVADSVASRLADANLAAIRAELERLMMSH